MKKLHISLKFSKLVVTKPLITKIAHIHSFIVKFVKILDIYKKFAGNRVGKNGNRPYCGVVPKFSNLEVIAMSATAEAFGFDGENYLFKRIHAEKGDSLHYYGYKLHAVCGISVVIHSFDMTAAIVHDLSYLQDVQWEYCDCMMLGDKGYISVEIQQNLFDVARITLEVPYRFNQKNWRPPAYAYKRFRKRIETLFFKLNDQFMMIRNYAKQPTGLFTRTAAKIAALTVLQYVNFVNHRKIGQLKYALI